MPEAPAIYHLGNKLRPFIGQKVIAAGGYGSMDTSWIPGQTLLDITNHGKYLFLHFKNGIVSLHLGLFGSVEINKRKSVNAKFYLVFNQGEINGYIVNAKKLENISPKLFDPRTDIMGESFQASHVKKLIKKQGEQRIDDILMDQDIFSGVGNKIRNEALYLSRIHPESIAANIPDAKLTALLKAVQKYAGIFYQNLLNKGINKEFSVYKKKEDPLGNKVTEKYLPKTKRKIYFSEAVQKLY